jgi:hypothetical protein
MPEFVTATLLMLVFADWLQLAAGDRLRAAQ